MSNVEEVIVRATKECKSCRQRHTGEATMDRNNPVPVELTAPNCDKVLTFELGTSDCGFSS
jgi:hypothetical protein